MKEGDRYESRFIGAGKVGFTLGKYLAMHDIEISGYYSRTLASAKEAAEFTQSRYYTSIEEITKDSDTFFSLCRMAQSVRYGMTCVICLSKIKYMSLQRFDSIDRFFDAENRGAYRYSIHPLYAIGSKATSYLDLGKACFTIEGSDAHLAELKALFSEMGNTVVAFLPTAKPSTMQPQLWSATRLSHWQIWAPPCLSNAAFRSGGSRGFISPSSGKRAERGRKGCGKCTYRPHRAWRCPNRIEAFAGDTEICSGKHCRSGYSDSLHRPFKQLIRIAQQKHPHKDYKHLEKELEQ